jgi:hypothetical protein
MSCLKQLFYSNSTDYNCIAFFSQKKELSWLSLTISYRLRFDFDVVQFSSWSWRNLRCWSRFRWQTASLGLQCLIYIRDDPCSLVMLLLVYYVIIRLWSCESSKVESPKMCCLLKTDLRLSIYSVVICYKKCTRPHTMAVR